LMTIKIALDARGPWLPLEAHGDFAFILYDEYRKHPEYRDYYLHHCPHELAMVDNSAYEIGVGASGEDYCNFIQEAGEHFKLVIYALPDVLKNWEETAVRSWQFFASFDFLLRKAIPMMVCQTFDVRKCIDFAHRVCADFVGLPIWMERVRPGSRVQMAKEISKEGLNAHLLGLDSYGELQRAREYAFSVDTSLPLTLAKNKVLDVDFDVNYHLERIDWNDSVSLDQLQLAVKHIELLRG